MSVPLSTVGQLVAPSAASLVALELGGGPTGGSLDQLGVQAAAFSSLRSLRLVNTAVDSVIPSGWQTVRGSLLHGYSEALRWFSAKDHTSCCLHDAVPHVGMLRCPHVLCIVCRRPHGCWTS